MGFASKLLTANRHAKSRLHDEKGNFVGWRRGLLHVVPALSTGFARIAFDYRPAMPWIGYDAIRHIDRFLDKTKRVLEFGSGMSTIWYSQRAGQVVSAENYRPWYDKVTKSLEECGVDNVDYRFVADKELYGRFMETDIAGFDLIVIDGSHRDLCAETACRIARPGAIIYLDNSDRSGAPGQAAMVAAEHQLRSFAARVGAEILEITDFAPTQFFVNQGLLVKVPQ